jgi:predicted lipoprotein with Yx(FWY)xxD motif
MSSFQSFQSSRLQLITGAARSAVAASVGIAGLALTGCANTPMAQAAVAETQTATRCDTNAGYGMTGVTHAATKREFDECRHLLAQRPSPVAVSQSQSQP